MAWVTPKQRHMWATIHLPQLPGETHAEAKVLMAHPPRSPCGRWGDGSESPIPAGATPAPLKPTLPVAAKPKIFIYFFFFNAQIMQSMS